MGGRTEEGLPRTFVCRPPMGRTRIHTHGSLVRSIQLKERKKKEPHQSTPTKTKNVRAPRVDEPRQVAALGAGSRHDGGLRARVDEGLDVLPVHLRVDVEHHHLPKRLVDGGGGGGVMVCCMVGWLVGWLV